MTFTFSHAATPAASAAAESSAEGQAVHDELADDDGDFRPESRCELVDWFAAGHANVPAPVTEKAQRYQNVCVLPLDGVTSETAATRLGGKLAFSQGGAGHRVQVIAADGSIARGYMIDKCELVGANQYVITWKVPLAGSAAVGDELLRETARHLALWMSYEDTARVAALKTRATRFERVRGEARVQDGQLLAINEYMHPRLQEIVETLPAFLDRKSVV